MRDGGEGKWGGGQSPMRQSDMVMSSAELAPAMESAGNVQQKLYT
jgi:hypothetical protein